MKCTECRFYENTCCHRYPPQSSAFTNGRSGEVESSFFFPDVSEHMWCGEFESKLKRRITLPPPRDGEVVMKGG